MFMDIFLIVLFGIWAWLVYRDHLLLARVCEQRDWLFNTLGKPEHLELLKKNEKDVKRLAIIISEYNKFL